MSNTKSHRLPIVLVITLAILLASVMTFSVVDGVTMAENTENIVEESSLKIGHVSDIHYFPIDHCYQDVTNANYATSDFYNSMTGDTKLVLESGMVLAQQIKQVIQDAKDGIAPMYMFASGDLSKNGEHTALIDVANALRYMQNEVRKVDGYKNFQVFATVGNHDLYNASGALYSQENGEGRESDGVSAFQFALIFAGLGYPEANLTGDDGAINLTEYLPDEYWHGTFTGGYIPTTTATNLEIHYYSDNLEQVAHNSALSNAEKLNLYYSLGDTLNVLTFSAEILDKKSYSIVVADASDRETEEVGAFVRVGASEFDYLKTAKPDTKYYLLDGEGSIEDGRSIETSKAYSCDSTEIVSAFASGKEVFRSTGLNHLCGGRLTEGVVNWIEEFAKAQNASTPTLGEETIICCFHQNALPHWEQEDEILKDFTIYNWEYTSKRLLAMGIRYVFTGHMHASDAMSYTDEAGRTLYDFQTGSIISYDSPRRYVTFTRYNCDGKLGETCESSIYRMDDSSNPLNEVPSYNVFEAEAFNSETFETALNAYNQAKENPNTPSDVIAEKWRQVVATNPDYLAYMIQYANGIGKMSYNDYINKEIYSQLLDRLVSHFLNQGTIDSLLSSVTGFVEDFATTGSTFSINGMVRSLVFPSVDYSTWTKDDQASGIIGLVNYILDTIVGGKDLGLVYKYQNVEYDTVLSLLDKVVANILDWSYGDESIQSEVNPTNNGKMKVQDIAAFILTAHTAGVEISLDETKESIAQAGYTERACGDDTYGYKHPTDATYRLRMVAAMNDMQNQLQSGKFVEDLLDAILEPLYTEEGSLLKSILNYRFDFEKAVDAGYLTERQFKSLQKGLSDLGASLPSLLDMLKGTFEEMGITVSVPSDFSLDAKDFCLLDLINDFLPTIKGIVGDMLGFSLDGPDVYSIIDNFLESYLVDSFYVGLGGIGEGIVIAFATDVYPDLTNPVDPREITLVQPHEDYKYADTQLSYLSSLNNVSTVGADFNSATQDNGRVPSRVTGNFDTTNSTSAYTVKFYTNEDVYGTFRLLDENGNVLGTVSTTKANALSAYAQNATDFLDVTAEGTFDGVKVSMLTQTKPQYIPLIDLGLLCLTHGEIMDDEDNLYTYADRDNVVAGSVIYWNVTTVTITGLQAGKTYYYDIVGNYAVGDNTAYFSLIDFIKEDGYDKDVLTFTTAKDDSVDSFEFLTIADIQGMIQGMYDSSHEAVEALLKDERTKDFDFILNAGDMCDNGKNFNQWGIALNTYQDLNLNTSVFFTSGNHENNSGAMNRYFNYTMSDENGNAQQISGEYYSFDYANSHFTVLDTNDADKNGLGKQQLEWLENDLKNSNAKWKFVLMHKSLYSAGSHATDSEVMTMREQLGAMFAEYGVNMVFAGHDHTYTTTVLVNKDGKAVDRTDPNGIRYTGDGVLYITLGTLGTKYYTYKENDVTTDAFNKDNSKLNTLDSQTFGKVTVGADEITFTGYYYNRETKQIEVIGTTTLNTFNYTLMVILLSTLIPGVAIIGAGTAAGIIIAKKKKKAKLATESKDDFEICDADETNENIAE